MKYLILIVFLIPISIFSQINFDGNISGNFQNDFQLYLPDKKLDFNINNPFSDFPEERLLNNGFTNLIYSSKKISMGLRYENYLNPLLGYPSGYKGEGITYRYFQFHNDEIDITVGNFYEQFGSGMILRAYEERNLGYDNAFEGVRMKFNIIKGINFKSLIGRQRIFFTKSDGIVRGLDSEFILNEIFNKLNLSSNLTLGLSFVSKYEKDNNPKYNLPENVGAWSSRFLFNLKNWNLEAEYVSKYNDPSYVNNFIFKKGNAILINTNYSIRGFGINLSAKRIDNMDFRSERNESLQNLLINFLPALTKQQTYALATIYPYATITNGEMGLQFDMNYKFKKQSFFGGKYGTGLNINFSNSYSIDKNKINNATDIGETGTLGYKSNFLKIGEVKFFQELNIEINKKISKKLNLISTYINTHYNSSEILGYSYQGMIYANIYILETQYKIKPKHSIRNEIQILKTQEHEGDWLMGLIEYSISPKYFFAFQNMYNSGNSIKKINYPTFSFGINKGKTRFSTTYGKQRAGVFCIGGVCRVVPASNGILLSINSTF